MGARGRVQIVAYGENDIIRKHDRHQRNILRLRAPHPVFQCRHPMERDTEGGVTPKFRFSNPSPPQPPPFPIIISLLTLVNTGFDLFCILSINNNQVTVTLIMLFYFDTYRLNIHFQHVRCLCSMGHYKFSNKLPLSVKYNPGMSIFKYSIYKSTPPIY